MTPTLCSIPDVARTLGVSQERVRQYVREGRLDAVRLGRVYAVSASAVRAFERRAPGRPRLAQAERAEVVADPTRKRSFPATAGSKMFAAMSSNGTRECTPGDALYPRGWLAWDRESYACPAQERRVYEAIMSGFVPPFNY